MRKTATVQPFWTLSEGLPINELTEGQVDDSAKTLHGADLQGVGNFTFLEAGYPQSLDQQSLLYHCVMVEKPFLCCDSA